MNDVFVYNLLFLTPIWFLVLGLEFLFVGILWLMRGYFEGWEYNNSRASEYGDRCLVGVIAIGATIIQRERPPLAGLLPMAILWLATAVSLGIILQVLISEIANRRKNHSGTKTDFYHNIVVVPALIYLLAITLPKICFLGFWYERIAAVIFFLVWVALVAYDSKTGRLKQTEWVINNAHRLLNNWREKNDPNYERIKS